MLSARAAHDAHMGRDARKDVILEVCWRDGRTEKMRRVAIAAFARGILYYGLMEQG